MAIQKPLLVALDNDFNVAVRYGAKDKAVATFSALVGIAISEVPAQARPLYGMLTKVTTVSLAQLTTDKNFVVALILKNGL
jgi:hypothetical protein